VWPVRPLLFISIGAGGQSPSISKFNEITSSQTSRYYKYFHSWHDLHISPVFSIKIPCRFSSDVTKCIDIEKAAIRPIAAWQRISHNTDLLNCQFYPSCSQYGAIAIKENGILKGLPMAADRIVRCNPSAFSNHIHMHGKFHKKDYRLVDYTQPDFESSNSKSPVLAGILSALLPGAGRVYAGKWFDGFMGFVMVFLTATSAYESSKRDNMFNKVFSYSMAGIFYTGEIYGAYRSAKYYQRQ